MNLDNHGNVFHLVEFFEEDVTNESDLYLGRIFSKMFCPALSLKLSLKLEIYNGKYE